MLWHKDQGDVHRFGSRFYQKGERPNAVNFQQHAIQSFTSSEWPKIT